MTIQDRFQEVLKPIINIDINQKPSIASWYIDELDMAELISDLESEFEMEINDNDVYSFKTVNDIIAYIEERIK